MANWCSAVGIGEGDALAEAVGVELLDASPIANFARNLSSSVDRPLLRGLGEGVDEVTGAGSATGEEADAVRTWLAPGLAGRWAAKDFLRLLNADSAR